MIPVVVNNALLDQLTEQAKASPRLRMNYDLRNSPEDGSQRMLNAIEPGSPLPIHRHKYTSETVVCLRGRFVEEFYDELERICTDRIELTPGGSGVPGWCFGRAFGTRCRRCKVARSCWSARTGSTNR